MADLRVVSETSEIELRRNRAEEELTLPFCELAANILRTVRGAGKPEYLLSQMQRAIDVSAAFREVHGQWPSAATISDVLKLQDEYTARENPELLRATHQLCRASLQICASRLVGQDTQRRTAENELHMRIVTIEEARAERRRKLAGAAKQAKRKRRRNK